MIVRNGCALVPGLLMLGFYLAAAPSGPHVPSKAFEALRLFPMHAFASAKGWLPQEMWLYPVVGLFAFAGILTLKKQEWAGPRGAREAHAPRIIRQPDRTWGVA